MLIVPLFVKLPVTTMSPVVVRAHQAPEGVTWIDVEVRNCRAAGKNWVIGCKYVEKPAWNAVVWLG
jgi:hypothetical protein